MTGERQPGARPPAPGPLALVQAFINSHYDLEVDHGADLFGTPAALRAWLHGHGLPAPARLTERDRRRAVELREGLRALAASPGDAAAIRRVNRAAAGAAVELRFAADGPTWVPVGGGALDRGLGIVLAQAAEAIATGTWARLKVCPGEDCGWVFYDSSRNRSGRWCSMAVCGGRAKARAHYQRRRGAGG